MENLSKKYMQLKKEGKYSYAIYVPATYDESKKYSLLIFLHGAGERGTNYEMLDNITQVGFFEQVLADNDLKDNFILLAPQCPNDMQWVNYPWLDGTYNFVLTEQSEPAKFAADLIFDKIMTEYNIDNSKVFITGLSMGGYGTWDMLARYPNKFAAAVTVCGGVDERLASYYKDIPVWICHGSCDSIVNCNAEKRTYALMVLNDAKDVHYTEYLGVDHNAWDYAYTDKQIFKWLISH